MSKSYKNEWFIRELINASAKKTLEEAAPEWVFSHFGYLGTKGNCQVCHARIAKVVAIKNRSNGMLLLIGEDCYDKLLHYLATQKLEAITSLKSRKQYIGQIKKYCKKEINEAFLEWFKGQRELPEATRNTLKVIQQLGYAPSLSAAEETVEYYKNHRLFPVEKLVGETWIGALRSIPWSLIPPNITLSQLPKIEELIEDWDKRWWTLKSRVWDSMRAEKSLKMEELLWPGGTDVQVVLSSRKRKFAVTVPVVAIQNRLGRGISWDFDTFKKAAPKRIRLDAIGYRSNFKLDNNDLMDWVREARRAIKLEECKKNALSLAFVRGFNRKNNIEQWEARKANILYVLKKENHYEPSEGEIQVAKAFDLVPDRVVLVQRI